MTSPVLKTLPELTAAGTPATTDLIPIYQGANPLKKLTWANAGAFLPFLQSGTGASATDTVRAKLRRVQVDIVDFGAVAGTNCSAALQAAHDALPANGGTIYAPPTASNYQLGTAVVFTKPVLLLGHSRTASTYNVTAAISAITTSAWIGCENLGFVATSAAVGACTFVVITNTVAANAGSYFRSCFFESADVCIRDRYTAAHTVADCIFNAYTTNALLVENFDDPDAGDSFIHGCTFQGTATSVSIRIPSASGIYITGNKFLASLGHIHIDFADLVVGNYIIANNSMEGHTSYAVKAGGSTTGVCTKIIINGNQISSTTPDDHLRFGQGCDYVTITNNIINGSNAALGRAIYFSTALGVNSVLIDNCLIYALAQAIVVPTTSIGLTVTSSVRFGDTVDTMITGMSDLFGTNQQALNSDIKVVAHRYLDNSSDTVFENRFLIRAAYGAKITVTFSGVIQGVGRCIYNGTYLVVGGAATLVSEAMVPAASLVVQAVTDGANVKVGIRRATAIGTAINGVLGIETSGYVEHLERTT